MVTDQFYAQIQQGPAFLLLGQQYLQLESGSDPFLAEIVQKFGPHARPATGYSQLLSFFTRESSVDLEAALAWMHGRSEHITVPEWLKHVASFSWNGVYTSAIDAIWSKAFQSEWRTLQPLLNSDYEPSNPRNRANLLCTYLFGCINRIEEAERPPLTARAFARRKRVALDFLGRLPEILTPFGTLLIEGYAGRHDWLTIEDLLSVLDELNEGQTHLFSVRDELSNDLRGHAYASDLVHEGKLVLHEESLAVCLLRGEEAGLLLPGEQPYEVKHNRRIQIDKEKSIVLTVPSDLWNRVSRSAIILDDSLLLADPPTSPARLYQEFREFLSESSARPIWKAYSKKLAFARHFEHQLYQEVEKQLKLVSTRDLQREPIILHGQTGTGKTIALGRLAYRIRRERHYPALFIERKTQRPQTSDIDAFCKWAEDGGAEACLVVWDGMEEIEQYYTLLQYLVGRGRKVVVVGSSYMLAESSRGDGRRKRKSHVAAPAQLEAAELKDLDRFLRTFNLALKQQGDTQPSTRARTLDETFLVALYHFLPPTRPHIITGLLSEVGRSEQKMRQFFQDGPPEPVFETALAAALYKAGLLSTSADNLSRQEEFAGENIDAFGRLIGLVMVPGNFGLTVPIELLIRTLDRYDVMSFVTLLKRLDIFRWYEDAVGNILVGPRHPLEAHLIMLSRLGGASFEVQYVQSLLSHVQERGNNNAEIQFAIELVRNMRPEERLGGASGARDGRVRTAFGRPTARYVPFYRDLAATLGKLREEHSLFNPRLMLQESTLLREAVKAQDRQGTPLPAAEEILQHAEEIINLAITHLDEEQQNKMLLSAIRVEYASILGSRIRHLLDHGGSRQEARQLFDRVRHEVFKAQSLDTENYYPIDVLAWVTSDLLEKGELAPAERVNVAADILHIFGRADSEDFSFYQRERFHIRRDDIAHVLHNLDLSNEAFDALQKMGSRAGYYLRAYRQAGLRPQDLSDQPISDVQQTRCRAAADYLEEHRQDIADDGRCLYLLLRLWWLSHTGKPIFFNERQTVPFTRNDWLYCYLLIQDLISAGEEYRSPSIKYLQGLAAFHIEYVEDSFTIFRELEREADYLQGRRRITRSYLACLRDASTGAGIPQLFTGSVRWVDSERNRGELYVEQLRRIVRFLPRDFNRPDIRKYESIQFHLAFNFIGPIADPIGYYRTQQEKHP